MDRKVRLVVFKTDLMKRGLISIFFMVLSISLLSQNNALVIKDNAFVVINGGAAGTEAVMVINQSNPSGIITTGTGGNIVAQGEFDYIKWNVQTGTGNYVIPFTANIGSVKMISEEPKF